jgi:hypothetical protein
MHRVLILAGLNMLISVISIPVSVYLIIGLISPDLNLNIEQKIRKSFGRKSSVIFVKPRSYIRKRNTFLIMLLILVEGTSKLVLYLLWPSLPSR